MGSAGRGPGHAACYDGPMNKGSNTHDGLWQDVLADVRELVKREAHPKRGTLLLSPEVAMRLTALQEFGAPKQARQEVNEPEAAASAAVSRAEAPASLFAAAGAEAHPPGWATLEELERTVSACTRCPLCGSRTQTVFSDGNPNAEVVFVGEAPGADEDRQGVPFVGRAGQYLTRIIERGMKMRREDVYICNVLKCRPPNNRDPSTEEKRSCEPYLVRQLDLIQPKVIVALGRHAANTLLKSDASTGALRGKWHEYNGIPLRVTYHPSYLLRCQNDPKKDREERAKVWDDIKAVLTLLGRPAP